MPVTITNLAFEGSQLIVRLKCQEGHETEWKSQPNCNDHFSWKPDKRCFCPIQCEYIPETSEIFDLAWIHWISKTSFYAIENRYLYGIVNRNYIEKSKAIREDMKQAKSIDLSGDGGCCSRGYNTKYLTFSFFHFPQRKLPRLEILTEWKRWDLKRLWNCWRMKILSQNR